MDNISEREISRIWQHQWLEKRLVTEDGEPIAVVYPGRLNDDQGADFRDGVIATQRGLLKGDIEVHVKSSDWRGHGHHRDAVYNRVILHVVMWPDTERATSLENGRKVSTLALHRYLRIPGGQLELARPSTVPCGQGARHLTEDAVARFLDEAGEERFAAKAAQFQAHLAQAEAGQVLYQGIMGALGYARNKLPFLELAAGLPLRTLESIARQEISDEDCLARQQARLLGMAGLLPTPRQNEWLEKLDRLWLVSRGNNAMSADVWHRFKVRPNNSPVRRLVAMSYLILRYRTTGILTGLVSLVKEAWLSRNCRRLEEGLMVAAGGCWATHSGSSAGNSLTLLGRGRAADIAVNALLPFTVAFSQFSSQPEMGKQALDLYRQYPRRAMNSVERQMTVQFGLSPGLVNSVRRQQGLIHVYRTRCAQGRCSECPLSQPEAGDDVQT